MDDKEIRVVIDATGSFSMLGKKNLPVYALHAIISLQQMQFLQKAVISIYVWQGDRVEPVTEDALAHPDGTDDVPALCGFLSDGAEDEAVCLFLTDACFEQRDWQYLQALPEHVRRNIIMIMLGADAESLQARQYFTHVYDLCDLPGAFQTALLLEEGEGF